MAKSQRDKFHLSHIKVMRDGKLQDLVVFTHEVLPQQNLSHIVAQSDQMIEAFLFRIALTHKFGRQVRHRQRMLPAAHGIEPIGVRLFPVSHTRLAPPSADEWKERRGTVQSVLDQITRKDVRELGRELLLALSTYEAAATAATAFIEIQHTMLFATVGQKT